MELQQHYFDSSLSVVNTTLKKKSWVQDLLKAVCHACHTFLGQIVLKISSSFCLDHFILDIWVNEQEYKMHNDSSSHF